MTMPTSQTMWIDLPLIDFRPDARFHSDEEIDDTAQSLAVNGQLQNVIVCKAGDRYELIVGGCRLRAAVKRDWKRIKADVYEGLTEGQKLGMIFSENEDRRNASPLYQAKILQSLMQVQNMDVQQLADERHKDRTTIVKYLSLANLSPSIWADVNRFTNLGLRHFLQILRIENADAQRKLAETAEADDLSAKELQKIVDRALGLSKERGGRPKGDKSPDAGGFAFTRKGGTFKLKASLSESEDWDAFAARLKEAFLAWRAANPAKPKRVKARAPIDETQLAPTESITA